MMMELSYLSFPFSFEVPYLSLEQAGIPLQVFFLWEGVEG
jgi:hypothetical protein